MHHRKDELKERTIRTRDEGKHQREKGRRKERGQEKEKRKERMKILKRHTAH